MVKRFNQGEVPRIGLEGFPMIESDRFCLSFRVDKINVRPDGTMIVWLDRGEVSNLQFDCSVALQEDDIRTGTVVCSSL
jgi:hypothetical protein